MMTIRRIQQHDDARIAEIIRGVTQQLISPPPNF